MTRRTTIEKQYWAEFCDAYSRQHRGWIASIEAHDARMSESGLLPIASSQALQGIVLQGRHPQPDLIVSAGSGENLLTHRIVQPTQIVALQTDSGLDEGLQIYDENGGLVQLRFRVPASPEALDGVTPS